MSKFHILVWVVIPCEKARVYVFFGTNDEIQGGQGTRTIFSHRFTLYSLKVKIPRQNNAMHRLSNGNRKEYMENRTEKITRTTIECSRHKTAISL